MKTIKTFFTLLATALVFGIHAQDFQGVATYQTSVNLNKDDFKIDTGVANMEQQEALLKMLQPYLKKEYNLSFSKKTSLFKEVEKLQQGGLPFMDMFDSFVGRGLLFKNTGTLISVRQTEFLGKVFLISDSLKSYEWKLGKESKMIGSYTCYKATTTKEVIEKEVKTMRGSDEIEEDETKKTVEVVAWYTPQIPVNQGPDDYWGLPGLIMEVSDGQSTILCSKVVLNPQEKNSIEPPKEGEEVTEKEYAEIMKKKLDELQETYGGKGRDAGNSEFKIQIPN